MSSGIGGRGRQQLYLTPQSAPRWPVKWEGKRDSSPCLSAKWEHGSSFAQCGCGGVCRGRGGRVLVTFCASWLGLTHRYCGLRIHACTVGEGVPVWALRARGEVTCGNHAYAVELERCFLTCSITCSIRRAINTVSYTPSYCPGKPFLLN